METIIKLAASCRKLLEETDNGDTMIIDEANDDSSKTPVRPDFSDLACQLQRPKELALSNLASKWQHPIKLGTMNL
jgi:hypothetical protein